MVSEHARLEAMRRDIATSTDPAWMRRYYGVHQFSPAFIIGLPIVGAILLFILFYAAASI
jgi:hypothetical protein